MLRDGYLHVFAAAFPVVDSSHGESRDIYRIWIPSHDQSATTRVRVDVRNCVYGRGR